MKKKITWFSILLFVCLTSLSFAISSDLEMVSYSTVDNALGDRYARITVKNIASGGRLVDSKYFTATLMDSNGTRIRGISGASFIRIDPSETKTVSIYFGKQQWPIASVEVD